MSFYCAAQNPSNWFLDPHRDWQCFPFDVFVTFRCVKEIDVLKKYIFGVFSFSEKYFLCSIKSVFWLATCFNVK